MADPLARVVILEGYPERGITPEQLTLFRGRVGGMVPWEGAKLRVVGLDELQRRHRTIVWVPGPPRPAAAVLTLLERQNPGIGALNWRVFAENVGASPKGRNYVFGILESSVLKLRGRDSKLCYGIEQITVK
ncbi:hypothetical protein ALC57_13826 [Trachymyrmex cornetzi]|uniref:DUF4780 domain-containing protein n=1 Tax=Trachymyrmex cornetzi TaxID=471704 RepID=A0A151IZ01_9HYME|nr:hypothetical protein ALC57_13826 [Trachymyrmex cornetzi]